MVQFMFEGSRTNFIFLSKFAYVLVRTGVAWLYLAINPGRDLQQKSRTNEEYDIIAPRLSRSNRHLR